MNHLIKQIQYIIRKAKASKIGAYSAQTAFFMFLSLIPLVMLSLSLLRQLGSSAETFSILAGEFAPGFFNTFLNLYLDEIIYDSNLSLTIASAAVLLWSASKGVFAIIGGLNSVYEIKENRNYFVLRLVAVLYTVVFVLILVAALMLMVFGGYFSDVLYSLFPKSKSLVYIISSLRFVLAFLILVFFFSLMFKTLPNSKMRFLDQVTGAVLAAAGWVAFSIAFSFFVDNFSNYANIYGSLTTIIVLMLWLYICMYIMFFGAQINLIFSSEKR